MIICQKAVQNPLVMPAAGQRPSVQDGGYDGELQPACVAIIVMNKHREENLLSVPFHYELRSNSHGGKACHLQTYIGGQGGWFDQSSINSCKRLQSVFSSRRMIGAKVKPRSSTDCSSLASHRGAVVKSKPAPWWRACLNHPVNSAASCCTPFS